MGNVFNVRACLCKWSENGYTAEDIVLTSKDQGKKLLKIEGTTYSIHIGFDITICANPSLFDKTDFMTASVKDKSGNFYYWFGDFLIIKDDGVASPVNIDDASILAALTLIRSTYTVDLLNDLKLNASDDVLQEYENILACIS